MPGHKKYVPTTSGEFSSACIEQGVTLHRALTSYAVARPTHYVRHLASSSITVLRAGESGARLADKVIEKPIDPRDCISRILCNIINASVEPLNPSADIPQFGQLSERYANACGTSEVCFALTLNEMLEQRSNGTLRYGGEIFVDNNGEAFALRKSYRYSSALALKTIVISQIPWEAGTLLFIDTPERTQGYDILPPEKFVIRPQSDIEEIGVTRLTAFAATPQQREYKLYEQNDSWAPGLAVLDTIAVGELQPLVQSAVLAIR